MRRAVLILFLLIPLGAAILLGLLASTDQLSAVRAWAPISVAEIRTSLGRLSAFRTNAVSSVELTDYAFELLQPEMKQGDGVVVAVRLVHKPTGKLIPDAVVFARRIDMAPDGMPTMTAPLKAVLGTEPGIYRFRTNLMMEGGWRLSLAAKLQGETGTVQNRLLLKALP